MRESVDRKLVANAFELLRANAARIAVCGYLISFWIPQFDGLSLIWVSVWGCLAFLNEDTKTARSTRSILVIPVGIFIASTAVSLLHSTRTTLGLIGSLPFLPGTLVFLLITFRFKDGDLELLYTTLSLLAASIATTILCMVIWHHDLTPTELVAAATLPIMVVPNDVIFLALLVPFCMAVLHRHGPAKERGIAILAILLVGLAIAFMRSRGAIVALVFELAIMARVVGRQVALLTLAATFMAILTAELFSGFELSFKVLADVTDTRSALWWSAWTQFVQAPILGHGPNTFGMLYADLVDRRLIPEGFAIDGRFVPWPHNLYLELLAERGLIGFAAFAFIMARLAGNLRIAVRSESRRDRIAAYAALAASAGFAISSIYELSFLRIWVVIGWLVLLGVSEVVRRSVLRDKSLGGRHVPS